MTTPGDQIPYSDPIWDVLDAMESSVEEPSSVPPDPWLDDGDLMGDFGQPPGAAEMGIEGIPVPPAEAAGIDLLPPESEPPALVSQGASEGPPLEPEPGRQGWGDLDPPLAARPFFTREGLSASPDGSRGRGGRGIRNRAASTGRWCPKERCTVDEEGCPSCDEWGDHGGGIEECYYEWEEKQREAPAE